jgi:hypothetical protein
MQNIFGEQVRQYGSEYRCTVSHPYHIMFTLENL